MDRHRLRPRPLARRDRRRVRAAAPYTVLALGARLAEALAAVHTAGLVHRDIKPGNVLLALDGPRLIDFGIARVGGATALTATDVVIGTPGYLAPEQAHARDEEVGPPSDVFALGCVLAYAATGRPPFGGGTATRSTGGRLPARASRAS
ncbi:serine/threonine-protein kinase [Streptomyces griseofuscus]|uniref:serine/threonine-protein kinase n=1 Tax=Streptomyces griseofuscus TaxID=146922 RepID=UPI001FCF84B4|nr:serine/threonine-protein kinase [Streptomyces griseofuscus]